MASEYEMLRARNMADNQRMLVDLGLEAMPESCLSSKPVRSLPVRRHFRNPDRVASLRVHEMATPDAHAVRANAEVVGYDRFTARAVGGAAGEQPQERRGRR